MAEYSYEDLEVLRPHWEEVFDEPMPMGFEIQPPQVPMLRKCLRDKSRAPLEAYIDGLGDDLY